MTVKTNFAVRYANVDENAKPVKKRLFVTNEVSRINGLVGKVKCSKRQQKSMKLLDVDEVDIAETLKNSSTIRADNGMDAKGRI